MESAFIIYNGLINSIIVFNGKSKYHIDLANKYLSYSRELAVISKKINPNWNYEKLKRSYADCWHLDKGNIELKSCFIATAAIGNSDHYIISELRSFRDNVLMRNIVGNSFVDLYYKISPPLADFISTSKILKISTLYFFIYPVYYITRIVHKILSYVKFAK